MRIIKTATGMDGRKIEVGDTVVSKLGVVGTVIRIWHQGYDGAIIETNTAPNPEFPNHRRGQAKTNYKKL